MLWPTLIFCRQFGSETTNISAFPVAAERPKVPKSAQEFINLPDRILLHGAINVGEVAVGEISD